MMCYHISLIKMAVAWASEINAFMCPHVFVSERKAQLENKTQFARNESILSVTSLGLTGRKSLL